MDQRVAQFLKTREKKKLNALTFETFENAAVLVLLSPKEQGGQVILTKRTETVAHHKGQICFPGGVNDPSDANLWQTALRECKEEIGLDPDNVEFLGELNEVTTPSGFHVVPYLGRVKRHCNWHLSPIEIAEIFEVPIPYLLEPHNHQFVEREMNGVSYLDPMFHYKDHQIWGATGRILLDFLEVWRSVNFS